MLLPTLNLTDLTLAQRDDHKLAFSATGEPLLVNTATGDSVPLAAVPAMTLGIGQAVSVPQPIQDAFSGDELTFAEADFGLWLTTATTTTPAWFASFTTLGVDLYGVFALPDTALSLPGMQFQQLALRVALQLRGTVVTRAFLAIGGMVTLNSAFANVELAGVTLACGLTLDVADLSELGTLLAEPASVLDAAFSGELRFVAAARRLAIGNYFVIDSADCNFALAVHSPANNRTLQLGDVNFTLKADTLALVGAQFAALDLACGYQAASERLFMTGSADVTLPATLDSVLTDGASNIRGSFAFEHKPQGTDRLTSLVVGIESLTLAPAINLLELRARDLALTFTYLDKNNAADVWTLALSGVGCQSWSRLTERLATAGVVQLPHADRLPDVQGTLALTLQDGASSGQIDYRLDFVRPDTGCHSTPPVPFDNGFGPLPLHLSHAFLTLHLSFEQSQLGDWQVLGSGLVSTIGWLHQPLPLAGVAFSAAAQGSGDSLPTVELAVSGGLPTLRLPPLIPGMGAIEIFAPQSLAVRLGETLAIEGRALVPSSADLLTNLNLPTEWHNVIAPISQLVTGLEATLAISVPIVEGDDPARMTVTLEPQNPPEFRLMEAISEVVRAVEGAVSADPDPATTLPSGDQEFFTARPHKIVFDVAVGEQFALTLSFSFLCNVFGETFDATAAFRFVDGQPEFLLMAGLTDPIRLVIPGIEPAHVLGSADLSQIVSDYNLDQHLSQIDLQLFPDAQPTDALATLQSLEDRLRALFDSPGMNNSLIFEIRDFGLRVRLDKAPSVSGTVRLVQLPGLLDAIMPENGFDFGLGCSVNRLFISVKGPATRSDSGLFEPHETDPLYSVPLGTVNGVDQFLHLFFGRFELEYSWTTNAFGFLFDAAVVPAPDSLMGLNVLGNGIYFPGQSTFVKISKPVSTGVYPIIIPEWAFSFAREASGGVNVNSAADEMGLQLYVGLPNTRLFTAFFKEFSLSPTYYLMQPGMIFDGGAIIGPHQPLDYANRDDFFDALIAGEAGNQLLIHYEIEKWVALLLPSGIGVMLNPLTLIPPYLHPMPPFWIYPPYYMGDIYFDSISMSVNLPHLLFFGIRFSRPLPSLSIQGMMELAALAMSGFAETIPDHSELRQVMYATLEINAKLPLIELLTGPLPALHLFFEVNVVDILNGLIRMGKAVQQAIEDGSDLVENLLDDPIAIVRMIPVEARRFAFPPANHPTATYDLLGFQFSGSLYVLTPEEFLAELKLYHEGQRVQPKGLAASQPEQFISADKITGSAPLAVQFNILTTPPPISVRWEFGDGSSITSPTPTHTFNTAGQYTVTATVTSVVAGNTETKRSRRTIVVQGVAIHQTGQLMATLKQTLRYVGNPLGYFSAENLTLYAHKKANALFPIVRDARLKPIQFEQSRQKQISQWLNAIWKPLLSMEIRAKDERKKLWSMAEIGEISDDIEKLIAKVARGIDGSKQIGALHSGQLKVLQTEFGKIVSTVLNRYELRTGASQTELAAQIVKAVVRASYKRKVTLLKANERLAVYKKVLPARRIEQVIKGIEACLEPALTLEKRGTLLKRGEAPALHRQLIGCIAREIIVPQGKRIDSLDELPLLQLDEASLANLLTTRLATRAKMTNKPVAMNVFHGLLTQRLISGTIKPAKPADDVDTIEEMVGYEIHSKPHPSGNTFAVPVAHAAPLYKVQRFAGRYQLLLLDGQNVVESYELPTWLIADIPETPKKPTLIRARLAVQERIVTRPRTAAEAAWVHDVTLVPDSYQKSIFARPEYVIKPDGGIHGALSIGDLLRQSSGDYVVPNAPTLLTGCVVNVWDIAELKLAGMLSAPNNVFLNGYANLELVIGRYSLILTGDFRLIAGDLWTNALAGNSQFAANVLNFSGEVTFKDNGVTKLRGEATGTIGTDSADLDLHIAVEYHDSWTLEIADAELFKVTMDADLDMHMTRNSSQFLLDAGGALGVKAWIATPDRVEVEVVPAMTACAKVPILPPPLPDGPFFKTECITTPAVTVEVPDFSNPDWDQLASGGVSADLQLTASNNGLDITLDVSAGGYDETFALPMLYNGT